MSKFANINTWIFDLDHTLYPAETKVVQAIFDKFYQYMMKYYGISREEAVEQLKNSSMSLTDILNDISKKYGIPIEDWFAFCNDVDISHVPACNITSQKLVTLSGNKVIFTNGPQSHTERMLNHLQLSHCFDIVSSSTDRNMRLKPAMDIYQELLSELGVSGDQCAMIEDHHRNLKPAYELGMVTVLVNNKEIKNHDYVKHQYPTLLDFLQDCS